MASEPQPNERPSNSFNSSERYIQRHPPVSRWGWPRETVKTLPEPSIDWSGCVDVRRLDLQAVQPTEIAINVENLVFDTETVWPTPLPAGFSPEAVLEEGCNPGLGIRGLHQKGITGKGVSIGIIDQPLLVTHKEYYDRVWHYEEYTESPTTPMHGPAVASLAVGSSVGIAPEVKLYFLAHSPTREKLDESRGWCLQRILEINQMLPADKRMRVVVCAFSASPGSPFDIMALEARRQGVLVISSNLERHWGLKYNGLGRAQGADPDDIRSYTLGHWWSLRPNIDQYISQDRLFAPMDARTMAGFYGDDVYSFYRYGGWSWVMPYIAGLYTLCIQVAPDITPQRFWELALSTGKYNEVDCNGQPLRLGPIVDPPALLAATMRS